MNITLNLNIEQVNLILEGLGELPAKKSAFLLTSLKYEAEQQIAAKQNESKQPEPKQEEAK